MIKIGFLCKILCCCDVIFEIKYPRAESEDLHSYPLPLVYVHMFMCISVFVYVYICVYVYLYICVYIVHTPPLPWVIEGWLSHFSECLYKRDLGQIGILGGNWHFRWGWIFLGGTWIKKSEYKSQAKKYGSDCNFYNFSRLVPYPNKFVVVCICTIIFHIFPPTHKYFFVSS